MLPRFCPSPCPFDPSSKDLDLQPLHSIHLVFSPTPSALASPALTMCSFPYLAPRPLTRSPSSPIWTGPDSSRRAPRLQRHSRFPSRRQPQPSLLKFPIRPPSFLRRRRNNRPSRHRRRPPPLLHPRLPLVPRPRLSLLPRHRPLRRLSSPRLNPARPSPSPHPRRSHPKSRALPRRLPASSQAPRPRLRQAPRQSREYQIFMTHSVASGTVC